MQTLHYRAANLPLLRGQRQLAVHHGLAPRQQIVSIHAYTACALGGTWPRRQGAQQHCLPNVSAPTACAASTAAVNTDNYSAGSACMQHMGGSYALLPVYT